MSMRRTRSQMKIDFPAQKLTSTRSLSKLKRVQEEEKKSSRRTSRSSSKAKLILSPVKPVAVQENHGTIKSIQATSSSSPFYTKSPAKRRMTFDENNENAGCSPTKKRNTSGDPIPPSPLVRQVDTTRIPLSPSRNNIMMNHQSSKGPLSPLFQRKTPTQGVSPKVGRALNFGDENQNYATPQPSSPSNDMTKARALNFSPVKSIVSPVKMYKQPTTPSKFTGLRGCESPVKNLMNSPVRNMHSPIRNMGILSPVRNMHSPIKSAQSPMRHTSFASPMKSPMLSPRRCMSPIKRIGIEISPRRSPRKCASPMKRIGMELESPRRSPRKCASPIKRLGIDVPQVSPFRLARQDSQCYKRAKQALHTALPDKLVCREKEYKEVNDFLDHHISKKIAGSLYISGAPGTGKTAVLSKTMHRIQDEGKVQIIYINCMSFKNSAAIYNRVLGELTGKDKKLSIKDATKGLEKGFSACKGMMVLILDEVDSLDSKNQEVLYTMFEWPALPKSKLILIGIANALDLTDRILPRLQAQPKCKPKIMNFSPYSKEQLVAVLKDRLSKVEVEGEVVMEPSAVQFCARKVAAVAGDMRKALDVCRRAVETVEAEVKKQQILQACKSPSKRTTVIPKKIGVAHILKIVNEVYGNRVTVQAGQPQTIPLQQKLAICSLLLMMKHGKVKEVTLGKYHETFSKVCKQQNVGGVDQSEFHSMISLIEARGIVSVKKGKDTRNAKVTLKLDEKELETALQDKTLMTNILSKGLPGK